MSNARNVIEMNIPVANIPVAEVRVLETVALEIGRDMAAAETAIDEAITLAAKLMARVPEARLRADLSAVVGQPIFDHIGGTISSLTASRGELVKVHRLLETLRREYALPEVSYGDKGQMAAVPGPADAPLRVVNA